jgi:hypothetical protein
MSSEAIGQQRLIWFKSGELQSGTNVLRGCLKSHHFINWLSRKRIAIKIADARRKSEAEQMT